MAARSWIVDKIDVIHEYDFILLQGSDSPLNRQFLHSGCRAAEVSMKSFPVTSRRPFLREVYRRTVLRPRPDGLLSSIKLPAFEAYFSTRKADS